MNILFLTYHFPSPEEAGVGRPWETAILLRELGHEILVVTAGTHYMTGRDTRRIRNRLWSKEELHGFNVIKTYAPPDYRHSPAKRIANYLIYASAALLAGATQGKVDAILMGTDPMSIVPVGVLLSTLKRAALVLDERDLYPDSLVALGYLTSPVLIRSLEAWHGYVRRRASSILAATPGIRRLLEEKQVNGQKIFVFPNVRSSFTGTNTLGEHDVRVRHGWSTKCLALYAGSMGQFNDLWTIIQAAEKIRDTSSDVHFVFIGEGEKRKAYEEYCGRTDLRNVTFLGALPWLETCHYLTAADITVVAAPDNPFWKCVLGSKTLDSFLLGKPIVFAGAGDTADLIRAAGAGLVVKSEDSESLASAVRYLSANPETTRKMGAAARDYFLSNFSREQLLTTMRDALLHTTNRS